MVARIPKDEIKTLTPTTRRGDYIDILPRLPEPLLFYVIGSSSVTC